eukprot:Tbor_TRINITY_DN3602_c1_g1::TRINITY_DN3602_c1_g1_i1::g.389::m.389/K19369/HSPB11; heat shock protein beta-11
MTVKLDVVLSTCGDEKYPASSAIDGKSNTFFITTGLYPQEIVFGVKSGAANVSKLTLITSGLKGIRVERSIEDTPMNFSPLLECEMPTPQPGPPQKQIEEFKINETTAGANVSFLKLIMESGYSDFAALYEFSIEGEELER